MQWKEQTKKRFWLKNCQDLATRCGGKARGWTDNAPGFLVSGNLKDAAINRNREHRAWSRRAGVETVMSSI